MVKQKHKSGFSIIELLVVIAIISLLIGILLPSLAKIKSVGKRTVCLANLRSAAVAFRMYLDENKDYMPPAAAYPSMNLNTDKPVAEYLKPFISAPKTLLCPADNGHKRNNYTERYYETEGSSYEYNVYLGGKRASKSLFTTDLGFAESEVHVLYDYDNFHGKKLRKGSINYLYADGHVGDRTGN